MTDKLKFLGSHLPVTLLSAKFGKKRELSSSAGYVDPQVIVKAKYLHNLFTMLGYKLDKDSDREGFNAIYTRQVPKLPKVSDKDYEAKEQEYLNFSKTFDSRLRAAGLKLGPANRATVLYVYPGLQVEATNNLSQVKIIKAKKHGEVSDAKTTLKSGGSPTDYTGPKDKADSMSGNPGKERSIVALLNKLATSGQDFDLCQVYLPGTNLFCGDNKGIPRQQMPQLKGKAVPGSWADKNLTPDSGGEVDSEEAFKDFLKKQGIAIHKKSIDVAKLKASQSQMVGGKIAGMFQALKANPTHPKITAPIFVSNDDYILDGHHRWAALVALDLASGLKEAVEMTVEVVDLPILKLIDLTNQFANKIGIAQKAGKLKEAASACCSCCAEGKECAGTETAASKKTPTTCLSRSLTYQSF